VNTEETPDVASGHVFKMTRWSSSSEILLDIDSYLDRYGVGYQDDTSYNPDGDPIYKITVKVERL